MTALHILSVAVSSALIIFLLAVIVWTFIEELPAVRATFPGASQAPVQPSAGDCTAPDDAQCEGGIVQPIHGEAA